ncbi:MAG: LmeA family phospholipid-binding protein [Anaerolineales bacterium]
MQSVSSTRVYVALTLVFLTLAGASLACQANLGGPTPSGPIVNATEPDAQGLKGLWASAVASAQQGDGQFHLTVSESQLTSFLATELAQQDSSLLEDPQVYLRDGLILFHSVAEQRFVRAQLQISIEPMVKDDGSLGFRVIDADFGPVPLPDSVKESISSLVSEALAGSVGTYATGIRLQAVSIEDGEMALSGQLR